MTFSGVILGCADLSWPCAGCNNTQRKINKIVDSKFLRNGLQMRMVFFSIPNVTDDQATRNENGVNE